MILKDRFNDAGLTIEVMDAPFVGVIRGRLRGPEVFQLDIRRKFKGSARSEYFVVYVPDGTLAHVDHVSKEWHQLVLSVKEPARDFEENLGQAPKWGAYKNDLDGWINSLLERAPRGTKKDDFVKRDGHWFVKRKAPSATRHILLGEDERQMFMCILPKRAASVEAAHAMLKAPEVIFAEGKAHGRTIRQGEWFFVNPSQAEIDSIQTGLKKNKLHIKTDVRVDLKGPGKPHTADELVQVPGFLMEHGFPVRGTETYVRGAVRHADHKTVKFQNWRKVIRNAEPKATNQSIAGGTWID